MFGSISFPRPLLWCFALGAWCASGASAQPVVVNEVLASNYAVETGAGGYPDWIELFNAGPDAVDLSGYGLTDDLDEPLKWRLPDGTTIPAGGFLLVFADDGAAGLHAPFKLDADGEAAGLFTPEGVVVDSVAFGPQTTDVAYGRSPDGGAWAFLSPPTPGAPNAADAYEGVAPAPAFSLPGGFYAGPQTVALGAGGLPGAVVRYTLDGTPPTETSPAYDAPVAVGATTVLRAAVFRPGYRPGPVATHTYLIDEPAHLPVVSLATDPAGFFSDETGIYVEGTRGIPGNCRDEPKNWNQDWERPVHVEFFEPDGTTALRQDAGVKIFGGCSRIYPQKSLALYARRAYGTARFEHRVFPDLDLDDFNNLILRSSAQDWWRTMFRDGLIQTVVRQGTDVDGQAYRPAVVFLNGQYWGIHNLREKLNEHFIESHYGYEEDEIDLLEINARPIVGTAAAYQAMLSDLQGRDLRAPGAYDHIGTLIDLDAYLDYQIAQIFSANGDWPGHNIKFWRPRVPEGRWRWLLYDLDFGFGGNAIGLYDTNSLARATATNSSSGFNPPWSTHLFRLLLQNPTFRETFVQRTAAHMNTTFATDRVLAVMDSLQAAIAPEVARHKARWPQSMSYAAEWDDLVEVMREFARRRAGYMRLHYNGYFGLSGSARLNLAVAEPGTGRIHAQGIPMPAEPIGAVFFKDVPVRLRAVPAEGYVFAGWEGDRAAPTDTLSVVLSEETTLTARFVPAGSVGVEPADGGPARLRAAYPNPFRDAARIEVDLAVPGPARLAVHDVLGRRVAVLFDGILPAGRRTFVLDAAPLPPGVYFYTLEADGRRLTRRMTRVR